MIILFTVFEYGKAFTAGYKIKGFKGVYFQMNAYTRIPNYSFVLPQEYYDQN